MTIELMSEVVPSQVSLRLTRPVKLGTIDYYDADLPAIVSDVSARLVTAGVNIYARGTGLVRVNALEGTDGGPKLPIIVPLKKHSLSEILTREFDWRVSDHKSERYIKCPFDVAETMLARQGDWPFPQLKSLVSAPTMRSDGTIVDEVGFDSRSGVFFASELDWGSIPREPTKADARDALQLINGIISDFPFVDEGDRSAAVAMLITAIIRTSLPTAPMFGVTAPTPGTGKSKLVDIAAIFATGRNAAVLAAPEREEELKKQVDAALMNGDPFLTFDNVERPLKSEFLCQLLTQEMVKSRVLGESRNLDLSTNLTFCATGNALTFIGDLPRRTVMIYLDARVERPEERVFSSDPVEIAKRDRVKYVTAGLTVISAYLRSGDAPVVPALGSFEVWSDRVRSALCWLGMSDPLSNASRARENNPEREHVSAILNALPPGPWPVTAIGGLLKDYSATYDALREALLDFDERGKFSTKRFAGFLRKHQGRPVDGRMVVSAGQNREKCGLWRIETLVGGLAPVEAF